MKTTVLDNEVKIRKFIGLALALPSITFLFYLVVDGMYQSWQLSVGIQRPDDNGTVPIRFIFLALILTLVGADIYTKATRAS